MSRGMRTYRYAFILKTSTSFKNTLTKLIYYIGCVFYSLHLDVLFERNKEVYTRRRYTSKSKTNLDNSSMSQYIKHHRKYKISMLWKLFNSYIIFTGNYKHSHGSRTLTNPPYNLRAIRQFVNKIPFFFYEFLHT